MAIDKNAKQGKRARRNWQKLSSRFSDEVTVSPPLTNAGNGGGLSLALAAAGGLELVSNELSINLNGTSSGLSLSASGITITLPANSGLVLSSSGLALDVLTTKGDLLTFSTVFARLGVGSDGQYLAADSAQGTGLIWATLSGRFVFNEVPSGTQDGVNTNFTLANTPTTGTVQAFRNGLLLTPTTDYTVAGTTITYVVPPIVTDVLLVHYMK